MTEYRMTRLALAVGLSLATATTLASPQSFKSARSFAMAGTGVAVATPADALVANPAMLAADHHSWNDDFGLQLISVNARLADEEDTIDQVDRIQNTINNLEQAVDNLNQTGAQNQAGILRDQLQAFDRDTMRANIGLGLGLAVPSQGLSVGVFTNGNLTATVRGEYAASDDALLAGLESGSVPATSGVTDGLESRGKILASAVAELGVTFARAIELNNGQRLQLGLSPKYVNLQTFQYTETVSGFEDEDFDGEQYQTDKSGFNLDLGAAYAFGSEQQWNAGASVRNLIPMELDSAASRPLLGEEVRTLELDPMVTVGLAHRGDYHVITAELDLTKKKAFGYEDDTQWLAVGAEFDAFRYAQLRIGARQNLASNEDNDGIEEKTQFTAGLGLNILGARVDLAGLVSDADVGAAIEVGAAF
ncbi:plasmid transfer operon, TraF, protein [Marinobacter gudaonensis]|uniref:Plasmid transfer operon, TraF, protein n=1 Tax=Marinobacter gudaonensis TaxID=375760 RepID=A0A1I6GSW9_9GAMM|nr:conjugal transfer protein TraF [Marinobacter gudaonensis]SFR45312.1 plasmid transfer operon, TraF, protein [Marinobacter gudaonensis]